MCSPAATYPLLPSNFHPSYSTPVPCPTNAAGAGTCECQTGWMVAGGKITKSTTRVRSARLL
eukprot:gene11048-biopygen1995